MAGLAVVHAVISVGVIDCMADFVVRIVNLELAACSGVGREDIAGWDCYRVPRALQC